MPAPSRDDTVLQIYERTVDELYRYASRLTGDRVAADELVQETYLHLVRHVRGGAVDHVDIGWLIVACRRRFLDDLRSRGRRARREDAFARAAAPATDPSAGGSTIHDTLDGLPPDQRAAMVLHYVDDLPVAEVARHLGRSERATESLLARARATLRARLGSHDPTAPHDPTAQHHPTAPAKEVRP